MDDFGNTYQTDEWAHTNEQQAYSTATYGMLDDDGLDWCMMHGIGYWRADI